MHNTRKAAAIRHVYDEGSGANGTSNDTAKPTTTGGDDRAEPWPDSSLPRQRDEDDRDGKVDHPEWPVRR